MKVIRHQKILELIKAQQVETQEELADLLRREGFEVTQATVSRDIKELKLSKMADTNGCVRYVAVNKIDVDFSEKYTRVLKEGLVSMDLAGNLLVVKTMSGMANAVAAALDQLPLDEIVGTLAGDDTIMCATKSEADAAEVLQKIRRFVL